MDGRLFQDNPEQAKAWDAYVAQNDRATNDHLFSWRRILRDSFGYHPYYLGAVEEGRLVGILPLFHVPRGIRSSALSSIPFGNYGGICADSQEAAGALLLEAQNLMRRLNGQYLELRHRLPLVTDGLHPQGLYSRFTLPLTGDPEEHLRRMGAHNRSKLQRSIRQGLQAESLLDVDRLYRIHTHTARRHGTPCFPRIYFESILREFDGRVRVHFITFQGRPIAFGLIFLFKASAVLQFNGALEDQFKHFPNNLLFWSAVQLGCELRLKELDYCRSRLDSGSATFKRRLHFAEEPLAYQYALSNGHGLPGRNPSNPKYQWIIRLWKRLPMAVTRAVGPRLVRYLS